MRHALKLPGGFYLDTIRDADAPSLVRHLSEPEVVRGTLTIPSPYTLDHAHLFIRTQQEANRARGVTVSFVIRDGDDELIGTIGLKPEDGPGAHRAEIGYWLARPWWGQGVTTAAVRALSGYAFEKLGLRRLVAQVYPWNQASIRVLEKCGFRREGYLRAHVLKDGEPVDVIAYGLLAGEVEG